MNRVIRYRNTDLTLVLDAACDPTPLQQELECGDDDLAIVVDITTSECGAWHVWGSGDCELPALEMITAWLDRIEGFSPEANAIWSRCSKRELDVAYDCGAGPHSDSDAFPEAVLSRIVACDVGLRITLYGSPPDDAACHGQPR